MKGLFFNEARLGKPEASGIDLLASSGELEIMRQRIKANAACWVTPAQDPNAMEFFYVISGRLMISLPDGDRIIGPTGSFYTRGLKQDVLVKTDVDTELLYVTTVRVYEENLEREKKLNELNARVDEKDHYTFKHSRRVMQYAVKLMEKLREYSDCPIEDIVIAARYHDVGKCMVPDEILKKPARLTDEEFAVMRRHPAYSAQVLKGMYTENIIRIAANHHERLDGSGYPNHLTARDLTLEDRILAVADSFDAMTSNRLYNRVKGAEEAALELVGLPGKYDIRVCEALLELVRSGMIDPNTMT